MAEGTPYRIEPCHIEQLPIALSDLITELVATAVPLGSKLHPRSAASLAELVALMNCYYSNLIEGHNTRPRDIERALAEEIAPGGERRDLQLEARAHIRVQREIDARHARGELGEPAARGFVLWVHRSFYQDAPASMLRIERDTGAFDMTPGEFRSEPKHDVAVGRHQPPSSARVAAFMEYFEDRYRFERLGMAARIVAIAAAHHRFNYIHPFLDGNGRVSRLMSHAMALQAGIGAHGLWSISRGLARGLRNASEYKAMLDDADSPRRGDSDGRGNLSEQALIAFVTWFCEVALDQLRFMSRLFDLAGLRQRLRAYASETLNTGDAGAALVDGVLARGEIARGEAALIIGRSERAARETLSRLTEQGLLASATPKGPVSLRFTSSSADVLFPLLFPAQLE
jgi:Fic family protein